MQGVSVQFVQFSSVHELFRPWLELTWLAWFGSDSFHSMESPIVWKDQRDSSRLPLLEIPISQPNVCRRDGGMVRFTGCACLLVRGVVWCGVRVTQIRFKIPLEEFVSFSSPAWSGRLPDRSVQFGARGLSASVQFVQFSSFNLVHELFWPCPPVHWHYHSTHRPFFITFRTAFT